LCALASLLVVATSTSVAQVAGPRGTGPLGTVETIDGRSLTGRLAVDAAGRATLVADDGQSASFDLGEMMSFEQAGVEARRVETEDRVWLRSGPELPAKKLRGVRATGQSPALLVVQLPSGVEVELPLSTLRAIRHGGLSRPRPNLFPKDLEAPPANNDLIYVIKDGQTTRSAVTVTAWTAERVEFDLRGGSYDFGLDGLAAVVFGDNTGFAPDRQPRPRTVVELTTGESIEGKLLEVGSELRCRIDEGSVVTVPIDRLHRLKVASERLVWLSELIPTVEQTPAFDRIWPCFVDRSTAGPGFVMAGTSYRRGIGMVPKTRLTYALDGRFDVFEATIGIDDRGGPEAHAVFRVFVDAELAFESQPKTRGMPAEAVRVELNGAKSLAIEADFGKNYDLGDFCAFADARVRQQ
jgi:hypothetical protein